MKARERPAAPRCPRRAGTQGGLGNTLPPGQGSYSGQARGSRRERRRRWCPEPDGRGRRDFCGYFYDSFPSGPPAPISSPREGPGSAQPRAHRDGVCHPRSGRAEIFLSLHPRTLYDLISCLGRALTVVVRKIRLIVRCSPHTFLTTVITKLIAGPKTDVKTS